MHITISCNYSLNILYRFLSFAVLIIVKARNETFENHHVPAAHIVSIKLLFKNLS